MLPKLNSAPQEFSACLSLNDNIPSCVPWPGLCLRLCWCLCLCRSRYRLPALPVASTSRESVRPQARSRSLVMSVRVSAPPCRYLCPSVGPFVDEDGSIHLDQEASFTASPPVTATCAIPHTDDGLQATAVCTGHPSSRCFHPPTHSSSAAVHLSHHCLPLHAAHDLPVPHHWSSVRVSSRRLASLPQVRGLIAQCTPPIRDRVDEPGSLRQKSKPVLTAIGQCYSATAFFVFLPRLNKPGPGSGAPAIARPKKTALRLASSRPLPTQLSS